jgi:hypothetical protein
MNLGTICLTATSTVTVRVLVIRRKGPDEVGGGGAP